MIYCDEKTVKNSNNKRIDYIDFLKFIGLTGVTLAHVNPPEWVFMLRNFDVPLLVIISSVLGEISFQKFNYTKTNVIQYYVKRIKRLVIPTWIFLCILFGVNLLLGRKHYDLQFYVASFLLSTYGIGFVWVVLMFLYSSLTVPLFTRWKLTKGGAIYILLIYAIYETAYFFQLGVTNKLIITTFYYFIPYGIVLTYLGCNYRKMGKCKYLVLFTSLTIFLILSFYYWQVYGTPQNVQIVKYPPRCYYLSYGIAASYGLLIFCENSYSKIYNNFLVKYISNHSMWIYLWHIS